MSSTSDLTQTVGNPTQYIPNEINHRADTIPAYYAAVKQAILAMYQRFDEPLSLQDMANVAALSPHHFNRIFRQIAGITPCQFLCAIRLKAAMHLLLTTPLSVTDVCFEVGYNSLGTFTTRFTQLIGVPPTQLRDIVHHALPMLELLAGQREHLTRATAAEGGIRGRVIAPESSSGWIFVGLFPTAMPQGYPLGCTLLSAPGSYRINPLVNPLPNGCYHLFAAAFPPSADPLSYLLPDPASLKVGVSQSPLRVGSNRAQGAPDGHLDIVLRAVKLTDPPILPALPLLLAGRHTNVELMFT